ncbi:MAG: cobalamin transport system ATP-binding protein [Eubacteriaceae bacterium]|jgi:iron complex transport system ATP-binding protein|nr:cobalamin transport system ATP-binding protein [Eubacteriaceae bacterium]MDK2961266.1 cobalamin transport system ATP-binding protein [Eubacteriaceae bacterium]
MIALQTEGLKVGYGKKVVVDSVEISGFRGQVLCLLGPNGAGKSTILRTLSGLLQPVDGVVFINQQDIKTIRKKELAKEMAIVLTKKFAAGMMKVYDVAAMGRYPHTGRFGSLGEKDHALVREALIRVNADYLSERYFEELSDGEKQKVMVARALVQEPEVIVLDEPTTHLDIRHRLELIDILKTLSKEKNITVILALHEIDLALKSCDKVLLVKDNKILGYGEPEDVVSEEMINELYGIKNAAFNNLLGTIELENRQKPSVFVIGGNGCGTPIYRTLSKHQIGTVTGVIHENDIDYEIARTMGIAIRSEQAFDEISELSYRAAIKMMESVDTVIDSGFPIRKINEKNLDLLKAAVKAGKKVISYRPQMEINEIYKTDKSEVIHCDKSCDLIHLLQQEKQSKPEVVPMRAVL